MDELDKEQKLREVFARVKISTGGRKKLRALMALWQKAIRAGLDPDFTDEIEEEFLDLAERLGYVYVDPDVSSTDLLNALEDRGWELDRLALDSADWYLVKPLTRRE